MIIYLLLSVKVNVNLVIQFPHFALITICHPIFVRLLHLWRSVSEALAHPGWRSVMIEKMDALIDNGTWDLVRLPAGKKAIGC